MRSLNSIEFIANQFTRYSFNDMNLFDVVPTLEKMTLEDLKDAFATFSDESGHTVFTVIPAEKAMNESSLCCRSRCIRRDWAGNLSEISPQMVGHFIFISMKMKQKQNIFKRN